ncbi:MAG: CTAG/PCC1 family protein [Candidatus Poseidoniales archaeon]|nr:CTAG/PCC1 family protein [Candidatus Poseidoniales archaeon]
MTPPAKKSESCTATLRLTEADQIQGLSACMQSEDADTSIVGDSLTVTVRGESLSDLRARLNSTLRSLQAASEALISVDASQGTSTKEQ